ncbi:tetratricopeptide repeat protein [Campylobacter corcagiensis]|uniref:tetratricopeptide repeat protein n=1 Tax=Campylobacter corcagiensis TaxID=1448857 RepID=UPI00046FA8BD|nr:sel1 repeat family protein [Campylobacter corcagiensis]QKF65478.1 Sel1 domain-containing protein [Campylobacter corcagiensis]
MKKILILSGLLSGLLFANDLLVVENNFEKCITKSDKDACGFVENYLKSGCEAGSWSKCFLYADMIGRAIGVERDYVGAYELFKAGCEANASESCYELSVQYLDGKGVPADFSKSGEALVKACDLGSKRACDVLQFVQ